MNWRKIPITLLAASFACLLSIVDFALPGTQFSAAQPAVSKQLEPYYNAGGNSHDSYKITTDVHSFWVDEHFARRIGRGSNQWKSQPLSVTK